MKFKIKKVLPELLFPVIERFYCKNTEYLGELYGKIDDDVVSIENVFYYCKVEETYKTVRSHKKPLEILIKENIEYVNKEVIHLGDVHSHTHLPALKKTKNRKEFIQQLVWYSNFSDADEELMSPGSYYLIIAVSEKNYRFERKPAKFDNSLIVLTKELVTAISGFYYDVEKFRFVKGAVKNE